METAHITPMDTGINLYTQSRQNHNSNPLFEDNDRTMSAGDYINIHQRQRNVIGGRFSWLIPDED